MKLRISKSKSDFKFLNTVVSIYFVDSENGGGTSGQNGQFVPTDDSPLSKNFAGVDKNSQSGGTDENFDIMSIIRSSIHNDYEGNVETTVGPTTTPSGRTFDAAEDGALEFEFPVFDVKTLDVLEVNTGHTFTEKDEHGSVVALDAHKSMPATEIIE